jgi:streptogramin lyase
MAEWVTNTSTGIKTLVVSSVDEFCTLDDICVQDANAWDPDYWWTTAYSGGNILRESLAPGGFYCKEFCADTFSPPKFYEFSDGCTPTGRDECSRGESTCDVNAYCKEPADQVGFECECDEKYFVSTIDGAACATSGVEMEFQMGGMILGSGLPGPGCECITTPVVCTADTTTTVYQADVIPDFLAPRGPYDSVLRPTAMWWKYCTGILANEHIYLIPANANAVGKYNPKTDTFSTIDMSAYRDYLLPDGSVAREPAAHDMSPGYALQTQYETNPGVDDQMAWSKFDRNKYSTALFVDGIIYCFPKNAASIGMIDTTTDTFSTVLRLFDAYRTTAPNNILSAMINGGVIYLFDGMMSTFDPATKEISNSVFLGSDDALHAISGPNGKIYLTPYTTVFTVEGSYHVPPVTTPTRIFHTIDNSVTEIDTLGVTSGISTQSYGNGVLHPNGKIYLAPLFAATIGVIDTLTDTFSTINITSIFPWGTTFETSWRAPHNYFKFFTAVLGNEGRVYFLPLYAPRMMVYDPDTGVFELILDTHPAPPVWGSVALPDPLYQLPAAPWNEGVMFEQKMYLIPFNAGGITVLDFGLCNEDAIACAALPTMTVYQAEALPDLSPPGGHSSTADWKYSAAIFVNEHIYLVPASADAVGKYNPKTNMFSTIDMTAYRDYLLPDGTVTREPSSASMSKGYALRSQYAYYDQSDQTNKMAWSVSDRLKYSSAVLFDGIIYCFPQEAASVGMIDPATDTFSTLLAVKGAWNVQFDNFPVISAVLSDGVLYLFATGFSKKFDPATKQVTGHYPTGADIRQAIPAPNGRIYLTPMTDKTLILHTSNHSVTEIDTQGVLSGTHNQSYGKGVLHPNGKIYLAPLFANTIGVIDTLTDTFSTINISSIFPSGATNDTTWNAAQNRDKFYTAVLGENGRVYFLPAHTPRMMVYDPSTGVFELILDTLNYINSSQATYPLLPAAHWNTGMMIEQKLYLIPSIAAGITVLDFGCCESCPPPPSIESNRANMVDARLKFIDELFSQQILNEQSSPALLIEGVRQYPIELVTASIEDPLSPLFMRSIWRIVLRAPDAHVNLAKLARDTSFDDTALWARVFADSDKYMINQVGQCANDRARSCDAGNPTCLDRAVCITDRADFTVNKLAAGGVTAPLQVGSSGLQILSVDYDITQSAFSVRMRYNDEIPGVIDAVFVSHMGADPNQLRLPTFRSDEFPCLPLGTGQFQNQRDNSGMPHSV